MEYVLVTGGVVSGLGKGVTASSIGILLKACGLRVTSIKIGIFLLVLWIEVSLPPSNTRRECIFCIFYVNKFSLLIKLSFSWLAHWITNLNVSLDYVRFHLNGSWNSFSCWTRRVFFPLVWYAKGLVCSFWADVFPSLLFSSLILEYSFLLNAFFFYIDKKRELFRFYVQYLSSIL